MFKLPDGIPNLASSAQEWADYAEYNALLNGKISFRSLTRISAIIEDEVEILGINDEADRFIVKTDEIAAEISRRIKISRNKYPFQLTDKDYSITYQSGKEYHNSIYKFLLLTTRLNMNKEKVQGDLDGTFLFEQLSAEVARAFFGENSSVDVLGTSKTQSGGFRIKLQEIIKKIGEGGRIHENPGYRPQDDNIDVVVWKGFSDKQPSQVIGFGQCKTGTTWSSNLSELNADAFCKSWFTSQPVLLPIRMFFCAQYFPNEIWRVRANEAGLVFDRFRILDYLPKQIDLDLLENIKNWVTAAESKLSLS